MEITPRYAKGIFSIAGSLTLICSMNIFQFAQQHYLPLLDKIVVGSQVSLLEQCNLLYDIQLF
jgi:hypothetical protein